MAGLQVMPIPVKVGGVDAWCNLSCLQASFGEGG